MAQYTKHSAVVNKIRAIVRLTGRALRHARRSDISADFARKIQKSAYDVSHKAKEETYTPPYKSIAKQLQVHDSHIYMAAVYNLVEIAKQQARYRDDIIKILSQQLKEAVLPPESHDYLEQKLAKFL